MTRPANECLDRMGQESGCAIGFDFFRAPLEFPSKVHHFHQIISERLFRLMAFFAGSVIDVQKAKRSCAPHIFTGRSRAWAKKGARLP